MIIYIEFETDVIRLFYSIVVLLTVYHLQITVECSSGKFTLKNSASVGRIKIRNFLTSTSFDYLHIFSIFICGGTDHSHGTSKKCSHYVACVSRVNEKDGPESGSATLIGPAGVQNNDISTSITSIGSPNSNKQTNNDSSNYNVISKTEDEDLDISSPKFTKLFTMPVMCSTNLSFTSLIKNLGPMELFSKFTKRTTEVDIKKLKLHQMCCWTNSSPKSL